MAGLMKDEFKEELLAELSWIMTAIDDLSSKSGIETYEIALIKNRVQMQEEKAIDKFLAFNFKNIDKLTIAEIQKIIGENYEEMTCKKWTLSEDLVQKLIDLRLRQSGE